MRSLAEPGAVGPGKHHPLLRRDAADAHLRHPRLLAHRGARWGSPPCGNLRLGGAVLPPLVLHLLYRYLVTKYS